MKKLLAAALIGACALGGTAQQPSAANSQSRSFNLIPNRIPKSSQKFPCAVQIDQVQSRRAVRSINDLQEGRAADLLPVTQTSQPFHTSFVLSRRPRLSPSHQVLQAL